MCNTHSNFTLQQSNKRHANNEHCLSKHSGQHFLFYLATYKKIILMERKLDSFISLISSTAKYMSLFGFAMLIILKVLLDLRLALYCVKYLSFLPVRTFFRENPPQLKGNWEVLWGHGGSEKYSSDIDRHGHAQIKQLGKYIYFSFYSQQVEYCFFGYIQSDYIIGDWHDKHDKNGYFGAFQLEIVNSCELKGLWIGHAKSTRQIRADALACRLIKN